MKALNLERAAEILKQASAFIAETENCNILEASGRILAEEIRALHDQPPFPRSPLDGYAVRSEDIQGASLDSPAVLQVIDEVTAGHMSEK